MDTENNEIPEEIEIPEEKESSRTPWPLILAVVVLTAVAVWLVPEEKKTPEPLPKMPTAEVQRPAPTAGNDNPASTADEPAVVAEEGAYARQYIAEIREQEGAPDKAFMKALQLQDQGKVTDAYLLLFFAARNQHADAALILGKQADPALFTVGGSVLEAADTEQAYKWYQVSAKAGNTEADSRLAELKNYVADEAAAGDSAAQRLMLQWK